MNEPLETVDLAPTRPRAVRRFMRDERGATLVEYVMLAGLVAIGAFAAFRTFGTNVSTAVTTQGTTVSSIPTAP